MSGVPRKSGRTQLAKIREWLQRTIDGRHRFAVERCDDNEWMAKLQVGRVPIARGFAKTERGARENAYFAAYWEYKTNPQSLKSYYSSYVKNRSFVELPRFPNEARTSSAEIPIVPSIDPSSASEENSRLDASFSKDVTEQIEKMRSHLDSVDLTLQRFESSMKTIDERIAFCALQYRDMDRMWDKKRQADETLSSLAVIQKSASMELDANNKELRATIKSLDRCVIRTDNLEQQIHPWMIRVVELESKLAEMHRKITDVQETVDLVIDDLPETKNARPVEGFAANSAANSANSHSASTPIFTDTSQPEGKQQTISALMHQHTPIPLKFKEFLADHLMPRMSDWGCSGSLATAKLACYAFAGTRLILFPHAGWSAAIIEALGNRCLHLSLEPMATWLGLTDWLNNRILDTWVHAYDNPTALCVLHFHNINRAQPQLWMGPLLNLLSGTNNYFPGYPDLVWPPNLKIVCDLARDADSVPPEPHFLEHLSALPKVPSEAVAVSSGIADLSLDDLLERGNEMASSCPGQDQLLDQSYLRRLANRDLAALVNVVSAAGERSANAFEIAKMLRLTWPRQYLQS